MTLWAPARSSWELVLMGPCPMVVPRKLKKRGWHGYARPMSTTLESGADATGWFPAIIATVGGLGRLAVR
jgi:hypothetical protein